MKNLRSLFVNGHSLSVRILTILMISSVFVACNDDDDNGSTKLSYKDGAIILNEGSWGKSNASVSFLNSQNKEVSGNIFKAANGNDAVLGDVLMDMTVANNEAFLVLNASNHVSVLNRETFEWVTNIENLNNPRFIAKHNDHLYVTQWGGATGEVVVINPVGHEIVKTIETGLGTEGILVHDDLIWVANSGGYSTDNSISVIDPATNSVVNTIQTPDGPKHFVVDKDNYIWVVCYGSTIYDNETWELIEETPSYLVKISGTSKEIIQEIKISDQNHPSHIGISPDGKTIYTADSRGVFAMPINAEAFPEAPFIANNGNFYGFSVHPDNGDIYVFVVPAWDKAGSIEIYNPANGQLAQTITEGLGIGPSRIIF